MGAYGTRSDYGEANSVRKKHNSATIVADVKRFGHQINRYGVLGTHKSSSNGLYATELEKKSRFGLSDQSISFTGFMLI